MDLKTAANLIRSEYAARCAKAEEAYRRLLLTSDALYEAEKAVRAATLDGKSAKEIKSLEAKKAEILGKLGRKESEFSPAPRCKICGDSGYTSNGFCECVRRRASRETQGKALPAFSFSKISGLDAYLSPEMKSTGEAIGYDKKLTRALYKALQASGMNVANYGTILVTVCDKDKEEALPLVRRFYNLGFNIEATAGTAKFLKENGIRTRVRGKLSDGKSDILESIRKGYVNYVINTRDVDSVSQQSDGYLIRRCAVENNVTMFTALDTVRVLLDVLEEITITISTIDEK